jgi:hypothetical protein
MTYFIFPKITLEQLNVLREDLRLKFYEAVANYGIYGTEPDFDGIERMLWILMKGVIDRGDGV